MATNDITGDTIKSGNRKEDKKKIDDNWDRIFGKKKEPVTKPAKPSNRS